jgi:hypothetical protein
MRLMSEPTPDDEAAREASLQRALDEPMPPVLRGQVEDLIEPHTMNMELKYGDVMTCIRVAWPVIRDWLRDHPADLDRRRQRPDPRAPAVNGRRRSTPAGRRAVWFALAALAVASVLLLWLVA